jgi:Carboxypeptidase regulatory-like domain
LERTQATIKTITVSTGKLRPRRNVSRYLAGTFICGALLACSSPTFAGSQQATSASATQSSPSTASPTAPAPALQLPDPQSSGSISGIIVDQSGTAIAGARIILAGGSQSSSQETLSDDQGRFSFANVASGPFQLSISAGDFDSRTVSGILHAGESCAVPPIKLALATVVTQVVVKPESVIAQEQIKQEEQQRVLNIVPNFYVTYLPDAAPLDTRQKFQLAWKSTFDPVTFGIVGAIAGIQQAAGQFNAYGPGAQGYAKRYGASYADVAIGTFLGSAVLPSLFKQDPRYFYKGTGSKRSRVLYALAFSVICKGDNGRWQPDYSSILGNLASGAISNLYYPPQDRNGAALTFESAAIGIGATGAANLLQEFVIRKFTPKARQRDRSKP